jgi:THO complex subunit 4
MSANKHKLDMSLGDIMKSSSNKNKSHKKSRGRGRGRRGRGRGRGRGGKKGSFKKGRGGYGASPRGRKNYRSKTPYNRSKSQTRVSTGNAISIANLDKEVTEDDVREIFQKIGKVKTAIVHYDAHGKSRGTAVVKFHRNTDAIKAVNEYHQAEVDGRPMYVKAVANVSNVKAAPQVRKSNRGRRNSRGRGRGRGRGGRKNSRGRGRGRRGRGGRGRGRGRKRTTQPTKTAEQLDKEMEDYHNMTSSVDSVAAGQPVLAE